MPWQNWYNFSVPGMDQTQITVPLSEAVVRSMPAELSARKEIGALCMRMTLERVSVHMENRITSPDWDWVDVGVSVVRFWDTYEGEGMGEGFTR